MKVKVVVIEIETPRWLKRAFAVAAPVLSIAVAGIVFANPPKQWATGDALTAADLNGLTVMTGANGSKYSIGATHYCGKGPVMTSGAFSYNTKTGYAAAKAMCEASTECGMSATAHMCTSEEILRSIGAGIFIPNTAGWYSTYAAQPSGATDCQAWINNAATVRGSAIGFIADPITFTCDSQAYVACCD